MIIEKINLTAVKTYLIDLQQHICHALEKEDGATKFNEDQWKHDSGGGGGR